MALRDASRSSRWAQSIGAEIRGVDLSRPLGNQTFQEVHQALMHHLVIFFRDQPIDLEQQKAVGRRFGSLHIHPTAPSAPGASRGAGG